MRSGSRTILRRWETCGLVFAEADTTALAGRGGAWGVNDLGSVGARSPPLVIIRMTDSKDSPATPRFTLAQRDVPFACILQRQMLRRGIRRFGAAAIVLTVAAAAACGSSDDASSGSDAGNDDATPSTDAAIASDATTSDGSIRDASSDGAAHDGGDASEADAGLDAGHDAGTAGLVTVRVTAFDGVNYVPFSAGIVVFYDPDGTAHPPLGSGARGVVTDTVYPGSSVTVSMPSYQVGYPDPSVGQKLITYLDIEPGDDLPVTTVHEVKYPPGEANGYALVTEPTGDAGGAYARTSLGNGCSGSSYVFFDPTYDMPAGASCVVGGNISALAIAYEVPSTIHGYAEGTAPWFDGGATITEGEWQPAIPTTLAPSGSFPAGIDQPTIGVGLRHGTLTYLDPTAVDYGALTYRPNIDGGSIEPASVALPPAGLIDNIVYQATLRFDTGGGGLYVIAANPLAQGLTLDAAELLPRVHDTAITYDEGSHVATVDFIANGSLAAAKGEIVTLYTTSFGWTIISPPATHVVAPPLTSDLVRGHFPVNDGGALSTPGVAIFDSTTLSSYAAFRPVQGTYFALSSRNDFSFGGYPASPIRVRMTTN